MAQAVSTLETFNYSTHVQTAIRLWNSEGGTAQAVSTLQTFNYSTHVQTAIAGRQQSVMLQSFLLIQPLTTQECVCDAANFGMDFVTSFK